MIIKKINRSKVKRSKLKRVKRTVKRSLKRGSFKNTKRTKKKVRNKRIKRMKGGANSDIERRTELEEFIADSEGVSKLRKILKENLDVPEDDVDKIGAKLNLDQRKKALIEEIIRLESLRAATPRALIIDPLEYHPWSKNQGEGEMSYDDFSKDAVRLGQAQAEWFFEQQNKIACGFGELFLKNTDFKINFSESMKSKLEQINQRIKTKCPGLSLVLDTISNLKGEITTYDENERLLSDKYLILCLYHNENCISSVGLNILVQKGCIFSVAINSRTKEEYSGKKYNKLLRAVVIILFENETNTQGFPIRLVKSTAESPISALLLIRDYDTEVIHKESPIMERPLSFDYFIKMGMQPDGRGENLNIFVPINKSNIKKAYAILDLLLDTANSSRNITCSG